MSEPYNFLLSLLGNQQEKSVPGTTGKTEFPYSGSEPFLSWFAAASSGEIICLRTFKPGLEENGAAQSLHEHGTS